jgi:hypothetical protein
MESQSLTVSSNGGRLRSLVSVLKVCEPGYVPVGSSIAVDLPEYKGIWDTGATNSVITQKIVDDRGLKPISATQVHGVNSSKISPVYLVDFLLPFGVIVQSLRVTLGDLPDGSDALIGMDVITLGDFSVTNLDGNTKMSFRVPSLREVDYVEEANRGKLLPRKQRRAMERKKSKPKES